METLSNIGLVNFIIKFNTEEKCINDMVEQRLSDGIICRKCNCKTKHHYIKSIKQFRCYECKSKTGLRVGTYMHHSKLPIQYWYICSYLMIESTKPISANQMKKHLGHKFYQPIFDMMHTIRTTMGRRDRLYNLQNQIEADDCFLRTYKLAKDRDESAKRIMKPDPNKRGRGSERVSQVLVAVESTYNPNNTNPNRPDKAVGFLRMESIQSGESKEINFTLKNMINGTNAVVTTDSWTGNMKIGEVAAQHLPVNTNKIDKEDIIQEHLPWVHKVVSNLKRQILGVHHSVSNKYVDNYLAEFQYKFNRRWMSSDEKIRRLFNAGMDMSWAA